jgi:hypothetical protein
LTRETGEPRSVVLHGEEHAEASSPAPVDRQWPTRELRAE